jgi:ubiquinone/menaquinone biosynthesis C-methylase UbiE
MSEKTNTSAAYKAAEVYEQFYVTSIFRYWTPLFVKRMTPQPGEKVLDVACGTGVVARFVVPLVKTQGKVVGVDVNPEMLEVACRKYSEYCEDIDWREGRAEHLPLPDKSFDLVMCQQGLQFFNDRPLAAREMKRVLRPGGRVGIAVWQPVEQNPFWLKVYQAMESVFKIPMEEIAKPFSFGDPNKLEDLLVNAGFQQVKVEQVRQDVFFEDVGHFVELFIKGAGAVMPTYANLDAHMQADLQAELTHKLELPIREHSQDGKLTFPMISNIAVGIA